ncbi:MAG: hypothetical protein AAF251_06415 [Pseudomonadota bacterium]
MGTYREHLSGLRNKMLQQFCSRTNANAALLYFVELEKKSVRLYPAYFYSADSDHKVTSIDDIDFGVVEIEAGNNRALEHKIKEYLKGDLAPFAQFDGSNRERTIQFLYSNPITPSTDQLSEQLAGVIVCSLAGRYDEQGGAEILPLCADAINAGRDQHFKDTVMAVHSLIGQVMLNEEPLLQPISEEIAKAIGARSVSCELGQGAVSAAARKVAGTTQENGEDIEVSTELDAKTMSVEIKQKGLLLRSVPFSPRGTLELHLNASATTNATVTFSEKSIKGSVSTHFTQSDKQIAQTAFDLVQSLYELEQRDTAQFDLIELYRRLREAEDTDSDVIGQFFQKNPAVIGVAEISFDIFRDGMPWEFVRKDGDFEIESSYIARIHQYMKNFYASDSNESVETILYGIDCQTQFSCLEFHLPTRNSKPTVFIIALSGSTVSRTDYKAIQEFIDEVFFNRKRNEFDKLRSNFLTEARHAVIHYFSNARDCMEGMLTSWNRGITSSKYWLDLLSNEDFKESLEAAYWNLNNANRILEDGRFLVNSIEPSSLNRKTVNIFDIIRDCQRIIQSERIRKNLVMSVKVSGAAPVNQTGDEVLLKIAMLNLFDNAVKYALHFSKVDILLTYGQHGYSFCIANESTDNVTPERLGLMLGVGYRGRQNDVLNVRPGTGLGLPVASKILLAHSPEAQLKIENTKIDEDPKRYWISFSFEMPYRTGTSRREM